ncbi:MAG: vgr related protein [Novosphingobium sp.]|nr:vgr related protein [Novosphingobium sp.]MCP5402588.1 vgr related protein [Novosphingobium sp.]
MLHEHACPVGGKRPLTKGEIDLVRSVFEDAVNTGPVTVVRRRWLPFQPRETVMAPCGHIHFHPRSPRYCDDFSQASMELQGLFIHEMTHVWQAQTRGRFYLPLHRHPFCRYVYSLRPGRPLSRYGIEQQAEIVRHAFLLRNGWKVAGVADASVYDLLVDFSGRD